MSLNKDEIIEDIKFENVEYISKNKANNKELEKDITKRIEVINKDRSNARELIKFNNSWWILAFCIISLIILSLIEDILPIFCNMSSNRIDTTIEVLKALIFLISGYLFSKISQDHPFNGWIALTL